MPKKTGPQTPSRGRPKKRPPNIDPRHPAGTPDPPDHVFTAHAKAEWERVLPLIERTGKLSELDRSTLTIYCLAWSDYLIAATELASEGRYFATDRGSVLPHPAIADQRAASKTMLDCSVRLGFSPRDRERMDEPAPDDERDPENSVLAYAQKAKQAAKARPAR